MRHRAHDASQEKGNQMSMKINLVVAGAMAAVLAMTASAAPAIAQQVSSRDPHAVTAGTYKVEPYHTQVTFSVSHFGVSEFSGFLSGGFGTLLIDPATATASRIEISIPVGSILTPAPVLDNMLKSDQWFDAAKYPNATFVSTKVTPTAPDSATVVGKLTLHGVTKQVTLQTRLVGSGTNPMDKTFNVGFEALGTIRRSDFGINQFLPLVGDEVALKIAAAFVLQK
jgi:polyisoprenoid-binding protein YceI